MESRLQNGIFIYRMGFLVTKGVSYLQNGILVLQTGISDFNSSAQIVDYISNELFASEAAIKLLDKLENSIMALEELSERYQLIDEEPWRSEGVRKIVVNNFLVYYWINTHERKVHMTAVIYTKRDQLKQLKLMNMDDE